MPSTALSRRAVLQGAGAALAGAAVAVPFRGFDSAAAAAPAHHGVFGYGVASGDPRRDAVVIWTRATPPGSPVAYPGSGHGAPLEVSWELARDEHFRHVVRRGRVRTHARHDHTVKVDVTGLSTYTHYWYRFRAAGQTSAVGRTRTAPDDAHRTHALRFALVSCSNYTGGYFGAYRGLAQRRDLDFVLHVGDYIYEYGNGADRYGPAELVGKRDAKPATETIDLAGYRLRHALHKADPDLREAHRVHPFITIFDDHEVANNTWNDGAENHTPGVEGSFHARRKQAYQAYMEWMPFRLPSQAVAHRGTRFFRRFTFGGLADLSVLETRQNRSKQIDVAPFSTSGGGFIPAGIPAVDKQLADPSRHLPEPEQLAWLKRGVTYRRDWHLVGNQVIMTPIRFPGAVLGAPASVPTLLNSDQWDGYQADQQSLISHLAKQAKHSGDAVVLTGDIHSSWATDIPDRLTAGYDSAGVEFVCPSVTSDGFYEIARNGAPAGTPAPALVTATKGATAAVQAQNPWVKYLDGIGHGYTIVDVTPDRVHGEWWLTPTPTAAQPDPRVVRSVVPRFAAGYETRRHTRSVQPAAHRLGRRADEPRH